MSSREERAIEMLKQTEWAGRDGNWCPKCERFRLRGHSASCPLAAILAETTEGWISVDALPQAPIRTWLNVQIHNFVTPAFRINRGYGWRDADGKVWGKGDVKAWRPLPAPPSSQGEQK